MRRLTTLFPSEFLEEHVEELGVVERDRKLQIPAFVWTFVFGFAAAERRNLASFRRCYNSTADKTHLTGWVLSAVDSDTRRVPPRRC